MSERSKFGHHLMAERDRRQPKDAPDRSPAADTRYIVYVRYSGDAEALKKCGLNVMGDAGGVALGEIHESRLEALAALENVIHINVERPVVQHLNTSVPQIHADQVRTGAPPYTGKNVIVGVIDDGIDIFHKNFRNNDAGNTSRILAIWDQTMVADPGQSPPIPYTIGVEFDANAIQTALQNPSVPFAHKEGKEGHGTHVAGIAAGNGLQADGCQGANVFVGVAPEADLVIVRVVTDDDSKNKKTSIGLAAQYILNLAATKKQAAVINISLGGIGPCDGTQDDETFLDGLIAAAPAGTAIVVSAGNNGGLGAATDSVNMLYHRGSHSVKAVAASGHVDFTLLVPPDLKETVLGEIWYSSGPGRLQLSIAGPDGSKGGPVPVGSAGTTLNIGADTVKIWSSINSLNNKGEITFNLVPAAGAALHAGQWIVTVTETAGTAVSADLWLQASSSAMHTVLAVADRSNDHTITSPATALNVIAVGAYGSKDGLLGDFSSRGPTYATDGRQKPDLSAPGLEVSEPWAGIRAPKPDGENHCCCDCCYDFYIDMQGTSMSAPHVTGVAALMLQKNATLTFSQIRTALQTSARPPAGGGALPDNDWGYGMVDALAAVNAIPAGPAAALGGAPITTTAPDDGGVDEVTASSAVGDGAPTQALRPAIHVRRSFSGLFSASSRGFAQIACDIAALGRDTPSLQVLISLTSKHFDEVRRLINSNRRVAVRWHRMLGPQLIRRILLGQSPLHGEPIIPLQLNGQSIPDRLVALLEMLGGVGSVRLRKDIADYRSLLLALPGVTLPQTGSLSGTKGTHGADRHT